MKLNFAALSGPAMLSTLRESRGQAGTVGTQAFMRRPACPGCGDGPGTSGDGGAALSTNTGMTVAAGVFVAIPCPQGSPPRPHYPEASKPTGIKVSPASPLVPSPAGKYAGGDPFDRDAFEERVAIMEFDGGMTRAEAEAAALALLGATV